MVYMEPHYEVYLFHRERERAHTQMHTLIAKLQTALVFIKIINNYFSKEAGYPRHDLDFTSMCNN